MPKFVCVSDTHMKHQKIDVPFGDVFVHAGDLTVSGTLEELYDVLTWISALPHALKLVTPGNHDKDLQDPKIVALLREKFPNIHILIDETITFEGLKIHGSPWVSVFGDWWFMIGSVEKRAQKWFMIPDDVDILITHMPAAGILDKDAYGERHGCIALDYRIARLTRLKLHVFGHIHPSAGILRRGQIISVNAASVRGEGRGVRKPFVVDIQEEKTYE